MTHSRSPNTATRTIDSGWPHRIRAGYDNHRDFVLLLALFAVLQSMLLIFFAPGGRFGDYSDYWYYQEMASRLDSGYFPYIHYWVEYPPLFPWLPVGAYWVSRLLPPAPHPQLWFYVVFGALMALFAVGNLALVYLLGLRLYGRDRPGRRRALRSATFYALLFGPIFVHAGWFDGASLFFLLLGLYLLLKNRPGLSGLAVGLGAMVKVLPLVLVPVGFKLLARRWRFLIVLGLTIVAINLPFYLANSVLFVASWRALLTQPSWETVFALLDGYYSYGLVIGNRFDPAQAGGGQRPEFLPWSAVLAVSGLVYLLVYLLPWQLPKVDRPPSRLRSVLEQFRHPVINGMGQAADPMSIVAFVGLSLNLFMVFSKGYSPQFLLWYLPFLVLAMPNGWGLAYATLLTVNAVVERIFFFFLLPEAQWLLAVTVLSRTVLMLILVPEFLAVMHFLPRPRWEKVRRWLSIPLVLATLVLIGFGSAAFVRDYGQQRYADSPQRSVVDRIRAAALPDDGVVVTSRQGFDAVAPFLPEQDVRLYTRDDGEFRPEAFEGQWAGFVGSHSRIWLFLDFAGGQSADWNVYLSQRLSQTGYSTTDEWVGPEQRLVHYASAAPSAIRMEDTNADFGDKVILDRVELDGDPLQGGQVLRLRLHWREPPAPDLNYKAFSHLISEQGQLHAQQDIPLQSSGRMGLLLPLDLAAGTYQLHVGVYDPQTGERLLLPSGQDSVVIDGIDVQ